MCGIAGIFRLDGSPLPKEARNSVQRMTARLVHRGPDGSGLWQEGPIALGHRRLSILDLAGGSQPMHSHDGRYTITYNGELYNYRDLARELRTHGAVFRTASDTEVIIESYRRFGVEALNHFEGMFAFALWDARSKHLFFARDRFGKKPFFYTIQHGCCYFASELSALTSLPDLTFTLDPTAIVRFLAYEYVPAPDTMYREVKTLLPAHYVIASPYGMPQVRYWDLPIPDEDRDQDPEDLAEELRSLLRAAVRRRMVSDVPLGVFLSGGIDSSLVTALMAEISETPVQTFSIGFTEASYDESNYARLIANHFCTDHHETILSADTCADILPTIVRAMDVPMADASLAPTYLLSKSTREHVTVALGGDGSDELWAGYENYAAYAIGLWYRKLPDIVRTKMLEPILSLLPSLPGYVNPRRALHTFFHASACPNWLRIQDLLTALRVDEMPNLFTRDFSKAHAQLLTADALFAATKLEYAHWPSAPSVTPLARAFHVYVRHYLPEDILVKVDRCSMLNSLEVRAPFLDTHLAEFTARLPLRYKCSGLKGKKLLRQAVAGILPQRILTRNKRGFQIPVAAWLRGKLRPLLDTYLHPERLRAQGIFNPTFVQNLVNQHCSGACDLRKELWTLLVLQLWLDAHAA